MWRGHCSFLRSSTASAFTPKSLTPSIIVAFLSSSFSLLSLFFLFPPPNTQNMHDEFVLSDTARAQVEQGLDLHDDTDDPTANFAAMVGLE